MRADQQAARGRPVGPAEHGVQGLAVGRSGEKVRQSFAHRMRQVEHQLAGRSRGRIARCGAKRNDHRQGSAGDTRQRPDAPRGEDIGHGRGDHHEAGHDDSGCSQGSSPGRTTAAPARPRPALSAGRWRPCRAAAARRGTGRRPSAGTACPPTIRISRPITSMATHSGKVALKRQGEEQAVHQHLVRHRVEHGAQGRDTVEPLGDVPVERIGQRGDQEQQGGLMKGAGAHKKDDRYGTEQPGQRQQVGERCRRPRSGVTEIAGDGAGNAANPSAGCSRHPSVSSASDSPICAADATNRSVSPR